MIKTLIFLVSSGQAIRLNLRILADGPELSVPKPAPRPGKYSLAVNPREVAVPTESTANKILGLSSIRHLEVNEMMSGYLSHGGAVNQTNYEVCAAKQSSLGSTRTGFDTCVSESVRYIAEDKEKFDAKKTASAASAHPEPLETKSSLVDLELQKHIGDSKTKFASSLEKLVQNCIKPEHTGPLNSVTLTDWEAIEGKPELKTSVEALMKWADHSELSHSLHKAIIFEEQLLDSLEAGREASGKSAQAVKKALLDISQEEPGDKYKPIVSDIETLTSRISESIIGSPVVNAFPEKCHHAKKVLADNPKNIAAAHEQLGVLAACPKTVEGVTEYQTLVIAVTLAQKFKTIRAVVDAQKITLGDCSAPPTWDANSPATDLYMFKSGTCGDAETSPKSELLKQQRQLLLSLDDSQKAPAGTES